MRPYILPAIVVSSLAAAGGLAVFDLPHHPATGALSTWANARPLLDAAAAQRSKTDFGRLPKDSSWLSNLIERTSAGGGLDSTDALLDRAADVLGGGQATAAREAIRDTQTRIHTKQHEIADLQMHLAGAPVENATALQDLVSRLSGSTVLASKETLKAEIEAREGEIARLDETLHTQIQAFGLNLGINIPSDQLDALLSMASGDDIASMLQAFAAIRAAAQTLSQETNRQGESVEVARRYYALYVVLVECAQRAQGKVIDHIDHEWLPKLDAITQEARRVQSEARRLADADPARAALLHANQDSLDLTLRAAGLYRQRLLDQKTAIASAHHKLDAIHAVALNTFRTVRLSSDLVDLMRTTAHEFGSVLALDLPPLRPFESLELKGEFARLSAQLRRATP